MAFKDMDLHMENDFWIDLHEISGQPVGGALSGKKSRF